jgi:hypothetical protein
MNEVTLSERLQDLIRACLVPNSERISLTDMIAVLQNEREVTLTETIERIKQKHIQMK